MEITLINKPEIVDQCQDITSWKIGICKVKLKNDFRSKKYKVYFFNIGNKTLLKPFQKYCEYEFEYLFQFQQPSCNDYDENRIVYI